MNARTRANLTAAAKVEALTHAKYLLFAEHARSRGHSELAEVFKLTAEQERLEHFADATRMLGVVRDDIENLRQAISGQLFAEAMYRDFVEQADADGDADAAALFNENARDEAHHRANLERILALAGA